MSSNTTRLPFASNMLNQILAEDTTAPQRPIFILGITERCGTSFLCDLLALHPDCLAVQERVPEDFFLAESRLITRYADNLFRIWAHWGLLDDGARVGAIPCAKHGMAELYQDRTMA